MSKKLIKMGQHFAKMYGAEFKNGFQIASLI